MTAIFISHSSADDKAAAEMKAWLEAQGHTSLFLDFDPEAGIKGGSDWEQILYHNLRQCQAVIALLTPDWLASKWCFAELVQARERGKAIFPVKVRPCEAGGVFGDIQHIDLIANPLEGYERLRLGLLERGLDPLDLFDWNPKRPPYPGLMAFQEEDAAIFFGRGEDILKTLETLDALRRQGGDAARFVLMLGASGSGKSSLARAGLIPRLRKKPAEWLPVPPFRPQVEPLDELAMALAMSFEALGKPRDWSAIAAELRGASRNPAGALVFARLVRDLAVAARQPEATVLLVIDQAEELFGYCPQEAAVRFLRLLRAALETGDRRLMAIATLRSDFLGEFQNHPVLQDSEYPQHFRYRAVPVDPMPLRNFPEIILGPARLAGLQLEEGLAEAMVTDTGTRDALPLLAFTLRRLHERHGKDGRLTLDEYQSLGRLEGAIREEAERVLAEANPSPEDLGALHAAFVPTMVRINAEGGYARRRARFDDLPRRALPLLRRFVDARLLVTDRDTEGRETIEVAHEALLRTWPQLGVWLAEDQDKLRLLDSLQRAAEEWDRSDRGDDLLSHRDGRLRDAEALAGSPRFALPDASVERAYLNACGAAQESREAAEKEERERRIRDAEKIAEEQTKAAEAQRRAKRASLIGLAIALAVAGLAGWQYYEAKQQAQRSNAGRLAIASDKEKTNHIDLALLVANEAIAATSIGRLEPAWLGRFLELAGMAIGASDAKPTPEAQNALVSALLTQPRLQRILRLSSGVNSVAFGPDGKRLAAGGYNATVRVWDAESGKPLGAFLAGQDANVNSIAFNPDSKRLALGMSDNTVQIRDAESGKRLGDLQGHTDSVLSVAFSPDGERLASGSVDNTVRLWGVESGKPLADPLTGHDYDVNSVVFSPDGKRLASGSTDNTVRLRDPESGLPLGDPLKTRGGGVTSIAFSPEGKRLASGGYTGTVERWDAETGQPLGEPLSHGNHVRSVAFSPDGKRLASGGDDKTVRLWDAETGQPLGEPLIGHEGEVRSVAFSSDGKRLVSGSYDQTVRIWDAERDQPFGEQLKGWGGVNVPLAFSPDGRRLAAGDFDGKLLLWDAETGKPIGESPKGHDQEVRCVAFSPDGKRLASGSGDTTVRLWDAETGKPLGEPMKGHQGPVTSVAFSHDGKRLASGSEDTTIQVWDAETGKPLGEPLIGHKAPIDRLAFTLSGKRLAASDKNKTFRFWDAESGKPLGDLPTNQESPIVSLAISLDGTRLAVSDEHNTLRFWDAESGKPLGDGPIDHKSRLVSLAFSPDGKRLATSNDDNTLWLWDAESGKPFAKYEINASQSLAFSPDGKRLASGGGAVRLWDAETGQPLTEPLHGHDGTVDVLVFSPDGKRLASVGYEQRYRLSTIWLWDVNLQSWKRRACAVANRNLTVKEWRKYMGDEPYRKTCPDLPGPDDAPKVTAGHSPPDGGKASPVEPPVTAPPVNHEVPANGASR